ncbi:MAG: hypothetical protein ACK41V_08990 [Acidovorax sp.]|uniref:hypothetical protein n=1 Tax=Acidovorax sp. TaxID=1872122 RepID=UPI00391C2068
MKVVTQNIHAPVYGHVAAGDITIVEHTNLHRELTWWDLSIDDLEQCLRKARSERWGAWRRFWFNTPGVILMLWTLGLLWFGISQLMHLRITITTPVESGLPSFLFLLAIVGVALPFAYWLQKLRRIEGHVMLAAQQEIDQIVLVLRRRK